MQSDPVSYQAQTNSPGRSHDIRNQIFYTNLKYKQRCMDEPMNI